MPLSFSPYGEEPHAVTSLFHGDNRAVCEVLSRITQVCGIVALLS